MSKVVYSKEIDDILARDFALKLLMPAIFIDYLVENNRLKTVGDMMREFRVDYDTARARCLQLGML